MWIRRRAEEWLKREGKSIDGPFRTSKLHTPEKTSKHVHYWWFEVEEELVESSPKRFVHLLGQMGAGSDDFCHLKVPFAFLKENKALLSFRSDGKYSLELSAEEGNTFRDLRGSGKVSFEEFVQ